MNYISKRSAPQILSVKNDYTFIFSNFLILALSNSSANSSLWIISFLRAQPEAF